MQSLDPEKVIKELKGKHWPIAIRDVAPHPDAVRLTGTTPNGLPSGVHTGGAWKLNGYVYKPVDVQPSMGCGYHIFSQEVEVLLEMTGQPLFPRNWWLERRNDRTFIVRAVAWIFPEDIDYENIDRDDALMVERGVMGLNARGWEINDGIPLAMSAGPEYTLFAYDMSAAQRMTGSGAYAADERSNVIEFFDRCGQTWLAKLRRNARKVFTDHILDPDMSGLPYVYSSMYRPLWIGVNVPDATYIHVMRPSLSEAIPHAWILTPQPLNDDYLRRHEFEYGWGPLTTKVAK
jgi:hypothetical protein